MGKTNDVTSVFMRKNENFAQVFNWKVFGGKSVIRSELLQELDTTELAIFQEDDTNTGTSVELYRDVKKKYVDKDREAYLILGIENQTDIHYARPVKDMFYDALEYRKQVANLREMHRQKKEHGSKAEFLSGFHREDRLIPIITLTIYFGAEEWDAPLSLYEMMQWNELDSDIKEFIQDYRIHLISPSTMTEEDFQKLGDSEFGGVMQFVRWSKDWKKMKQYMEGQPLAMREMSVEGVEVLNAITGRKLSYNREDKVINVCKAWDDIRDMDMAKGKAEGKAEIFGLLKWLVGQGRVEEALVAAEDEKLQDLLLAEYHAAERVAFA